MNLKLKHLIHEAVENAIQSNAEDELWPYFIHENLVDNMVDAAEAVFDSAQKAQDFYKHQTQDGRPG